MFEKDECKIAKFENCGTTVEVYISSTEYDGHVSNRVKVEFLGQTVYLEFNNWGKVGDFIHHLGSVVRYHDLAGGTSDIVDFIDRYCVCDTDFIDDKFYVID